MTLRHIEAQIETEHLKLGVLVRSWKPKLTGIRHFEKSIVCEDVQQYVITRETTQVVYLDPPHRGQENSSSQD